MGIALLAAYTVILLYLSYHERRKAGQVQSFFINSRSSTAMGVGLSIIVSCVGASATIGVAGMAFTIGTPAMWWLGMGAFSLLFLGLFLAKKVRASNAFTMPQLVELFLGKPARALISFVIVIAWVAILAAQFSALVRIITALTGFAPIVCLALSALLIIAHTLAGGQAAVMRLDRIQSIAIFGGLVVVFMWFANANPTWAEHVSFELVNADFTSGRLLYYFFIIGGSYIVCPMLFGRLLCAKDAATARRGGIIAAAGLLFSSALIVSIGLACKGLIPADTPADAVLATALVSILPMWLNLLVLLALMGAVVSSADSCLITAGTVLSYDLLRKTDVRTCRFCIVLLGCAGAAASLADKSILGFLLLSYDIYVCGVVVPVFTGLLLSRHYRINSGFACAAVIIGGSMGLVSGLTEIMLWSYAGLASAALVTLAGARRACPEQPVELPNF